jgi:hypothetical protein
MPAASVIDHLSLQCCLVEQVRYVNEPDDTTYGRLTACGTDGGALCGPRRRFAPASVTDQRDRNVSHLMVFMREATSLLARRRLFLQTIALLSQPWRSPHSPSQ